MTSAAAQAHRHVEHCMGTVFSITVVTPGFDPAAVADVVRWLHRVDATFSTYRADSDVSRLARGDVSLDDCAPDVRVVLDQCERLRAETYGYFSAYASGALDPSGFVKGWAIERASDLLVAAGSSDHCVNGGGDVQCVGLSAGGRPWRIGVAHPLRQRELVATFTGTALAVATSGTAERGRHIFDPHTGQRPATFSSVTVVGERLADADAHATAAFAMGENAERWLDERGMTAVTVHADGRVHVMRA